jgi:hypothetical protein
MEFTCTVEVSDGQEVVSKHGCPSPRATCAEAVADAAWQALMNWSCSWHHDLMDSMYALYTRRKKDAFKISRVNPQIIRGAMAHNTRLSLDLSNRLLATQREIHNLHTQLADMQDTLHARQRMQAS